MLEVNGIKNAEQLNIKNAESSKKTSNTTPFSFYLGETKSMDDIFKRAADKYGVPLNLLKAIGKTESNFNPKAVSKSGARGVMQLMPATAKELGVVDSFDPEQNIMGGAKYISSMLKRYNGDQKLALAAYNAGAGNVSKYGGVPPFKETQNYVVKVANYMKQSLDANIPVATNHQSSVSTTNVSSSLNSPVRVTKDFLILNEQMNDYDNIFSYPDYLKFLDILLKYENKKTAEEEMDNDYLASQQINYNVPVMNLLNQIQ